MTKTQRRVKAASDALSLEGGIRITCDACGTDVSHTTRIACAECEEECDLCIPCFRKGAKFGYHLPWHSYRIVETHSVPIYEPSWGADEELLLIQGLQLHGLGNWQEVAEHIGTRTKEECERHYERVYLLNDGKAGARLLPTPKRFDISREEFQARKKRRLEELRKPGPLHAGLLEQRASAPASGDIAGWMPGRLEFEHEVDNDAEMVIKDMYFGTVLKYGGDQQPAEPPVKIEPPPPPAEETEAEGEKDEEKDKEKKEEDQDLPHTEPEDEDELELKLAMLEVYFETLRKRADVKDFIFDRGLMDYKRISVAERKRAKDEKELTHRFKVFAKLQTAADFEVLVDGLLYEQTLRKRIAELQDYRRQGITSAADVARYEKVKAERATGYRTATMPVPRIPLSASERGLKRFVPGEEGRVQPIARMHHLALLSIEEQNLCSKLAILPRPFLVIKDHLVRENARRGGLLTKEDAQKILSIDEDKVGKIYDSLRDLGILFQPQEPFRNRDEAIHSAPGEVVIQ